MKPSTLVCGAVLVLIMVGAVAAAAEPLAWVDATGNVGGDKWGPGGVTVIACVPGADEVIAGVADSGLWSSSDGGQTWSPMGEKAKIANRPYSIVFDPKDPKVFWESGWSGPGVYRTADGGRTFDRLGVIPNVEGLAVDFADAARKTLVVGLHDKPQSVTVSSDGGKTWRPIGKTLPAWTNYSTNPIAIDAKTYIIGTAGTMKDKLPAVFRTEDGGQTWQQVSDQAAAGRPLVASDGAIWWGLAGEKGLIRSKDQGKTWAAVEGPVKRTPVEMPGGRLVAPAGQQLHASTDGGKTWTAFGPPAPFAPAAVAYNEQRKAIFISRSSDKKIPDAIARLDLAGGLGAVIPRKLVVWDGEEKVRGSGWSKPDGTTGWKVQGEVARGSKGLELHLEGKGWAGGGWNWHSWYPKDSGTDISGFTTLTFWIKVVGEKPQGASVSVDLNCSGDGTKPTAQAKVLKYCPNLFDGQWHEVAVPLKDMPAPPEFNLKKAWMIDVGVSGAEVKLNIYIDDIAFDDRPM